MKGGYSPIPLLLVLPHGVFERPLGVLILLLVLRVDGSKGESAFRLLRNLRDGRDRLGGVSVSEHSDARMG
jgi:hypothetical protein